MPLIYGGREGPSIATSIWRFCNGTMQWKFSMEAQNGSAYILYSSNISQSHFEFSYRGPSSRPARRIIKPAEAG